jgi:tRNA U34 5-methylaminomethyl-2-thiouridine-forming methyltransferase MnmC
MDKNPFKGTLGTYKPLKTDDGSISLYSSAFDETCHSQNGAIVETKHVYLEGALVKKHFNKFSHGVIFEVGFGTGIGYNTTVNYLNELKEESPFTLDFVSCEIDQGLAQYSLENLKEQNLITEYRLQNVDELSYFQASLSDNITLVVLIGDVRKTLPLWARNPLFQKFERIYHDPFSPKKNPLLWTKDWFQELYKHSSSDAVLSTYSSTRAAWKSLLNTNWHVETFTGFGQKKLSTRAMKNGETKPEIFQLCANSPKEEFRDKDYLNA